MKKGIVIIALIVTMLFVTACGNSNSGTPNAPTGNPKESEGVSTEGENASVDGDQGEVIEYVDSGMTFITPSTYVENEDKVYIYHYGGEYDSGLFAVVFNIYPDSYENLMAKSEEEFNQAKELAVCPLIVIRASDKWDKVSLEEWLELEEGDPKLEEFKKEGEETFYVLKDDSISEELPEELKPIYEGIIKELFDVENNIIIYEANSKIREVEGPVDIGQTISFTTTDVNGNEVKSEDIFSQNKYTMVNCWASWCGPCVSELPELEKMSKTFAENDCGLIGILVDGSSSKGLSDGKEIIADTGVTYLNIIDWDGFYDEIPVQAYPTTFFVDSNGVVVGETVLGVRTKSYERIMMSLLG